MIGGRQPLPAGTTLLWTAIQLKARLEAPFNPATPAAPVPEQHIKAVYLQRLANSLAERKGQPLVDAARWLLVEFVRDKQIATPQFEAAREILIAHFDEINEYNSDRILNAYGAYFLDLRIVPALRRLLDRPSDPIFEGTRTAALREWLKLAPGDAHPNGSDAELGQAGGR